MFEQEIEFFVSNGSLSPFIGYSRPSFLFGPNFSFSLVFFVLASGILTLIFCFFCLRFFRNGFFNLLIVRSRSSFLFSQIYFLNCASGF